MLLIIERDSVAKALIYHQLGYIALHRGDSADALSLWENALRFHPTYLSAALNYQWLRLRYRPPATPTMTLRKYYDNFPPPSEKAPPHLGGKGAIVLEVPRWLSVVRMKE
ncbi:MAG: hypothetical protein RMJ66_07305 [Bacteroidia bacterium]|nr:hypothetical protein [Bacteroidia bacterium]MDW8134860.1 hypothetical protein [Bacteroidia bacterium]